MVRLTTHRTHTVVNMMRLLDNVPMVMSKLCIHTCSHICGDAIWFTRAKKVHRKPKYLVHGYHVGCMINVHVGYHLGSIDFKTTFTIKLACMFWFQL